jgi:arsenate reductase
MNRPYHILFICTKNAGRSILAEALTSTLSHGRFIGYSAGSQPSGIIHPMVMRLAKEMGYPTNLLRSKSWDEYGRDGAPHMDFIITLCDSAAGEECPLWPGHPATAHWGFPDPANVELGDAAMLAAFKSVEMGLRNRIELLMDLPVNTLSHLEIKERLHNVHQRLKFS